MVWVRNVRGGNISALRIAIHNKKPDIVILTETRIEDGHFNGIGVFRGYKLTQHSSSGRRSGGVAVFVRKDLQEIDGTIRNSNSGHSTIGAYNMKGEKK
jgi:exonuclease III